MGKKYIVKLDDNKLAYTAIIIDGVPYIKPLQLLPYTEPDTNEAYQRGYEEGYAVGEAKKNSVEDEAYRRGFASAKHDCEDCQEIRADAEQELADKAYQRGLNDAWEAARKIEHLSEAEKFEIFGEYDMFHIMRRYTPAEAIEKIRQHEREQRQEEEQIQVGDEVIVDGEKCVVLVVDKDGFPEKLLEPDGYTLTLTTDVKLPKTGRHFPEISAVLAKMKEES